MENVEFAVAGLRFLIERKELPQQVDQAEVVLKDNRLDAFIDKSRTGARRLQLMGASTRDDETVRRR